MSDWLNTLMVGAGAYLHIQGAVTFTTGQVDLTATPPPLVIGAAPDSKATAVGMLAYSGTDDPLLSDVTQPLQFLIVSPDYTGMTAISSALFDALHGQVGLTLGGIWCSLIARNSSAPLGRNQQGYWEQADNYYFNANRPTASRPD